MARKKSEGTTDDVVSPPAAEDAQVAGDTNLTGADPTAPAERQEAEAHTPFQFEHAGPVTPPDEPDATEPDGPAVAEPVETAAVDTAAVETGRVEAADPWARASRDEPAEEAREAEMTPWTATAPAAAGDSASTTTRAAEDDLREEEHGWSFAARALAALVLLLVGAGFGIWAAPRIAPRLPAGMAPVAAWLTPGAREAGAEAAALKTEVDGLRDQLAALPDPAAAEARTKAAVDALRSELVGQIDGLRQDLSQSAAGDVGDRVGRLETAIAGTTAELSALKEQIEAGATGLSADAAQGLDTYRAGLEGLRAEVSRLSGSVSGLGARFDAAEAAAEARASEAEQKAAEVEQTATAARDHAAMLADLATIRAALASGQPYAEPVERLAQDAGVTVPPGLAAAAATGVATPAELRASFGPAAHAAIRASIEAGAGDGIMARARAFLDAQMASRSLTPREGMDPDAVLSRVEDALKRDDIDAALAEAERLPSEAKAALGDWIAAAQQRAEAVDGLAKLAAATPATN